MAIKKPNATDTLPILLEDNPSRDFYYPLSGAETLEALKSLPKNDYEGITHIWLRRPKKQDYIEGKLPFAWFTCGSGVRAIVMFAWPKDLKISYGSKRPSNRIINELNKFDAKLEILRVDSAFKGIFCIVLLAEDEVKLIQNYCILNVLPVR